MMTQSKSKHCHVDGKHAYLCRSGQVQAPSCSILCAISLLPGCYRKISQVERRYNCRLTVGLVTLARLSGDSLSVTVESDLLGSLAHVGT